MSTALLKQLLYGKDFSLHGPADFLHLCEEWKADIKPESFDPLIPLTGGMSFQIVNDNRSGQALVFGNDWVNQCIRAGANTKNAVICLASNFDDHMGLVALSLELGMVALKPRTPDGLRIDANTFMEILNEVFVKDYAHVQRMSSEWGVDGIKEGIEIGPKRTRSIWRDELGYDVLIHPVTLEPCRHEDGSALKYNGTIHSSSEDKCHFAFEHHTTGEEVLSQVFLPA
ncbi:MAG: hypothetical protein NUV60_00160 [Patescibacteria group bacterium]|nr:hypothetical protein [Patescibacteria group bacterium]